MSDYNDYMALKERHEKAQREADRASGAVEQAEKQLMEKFNCPSLKEAEEKLKQLKSKESKARKSFDFLLEQFEEKWPENE